MRKNVFTRASRNYKNGNFDKMSVDRTHNCFRLGKVPRNSGIDPVRLLLCNLCNQKEIKSQKPDQNNLKSRKLNNKLGAIYTTYIISRLVIELKSGRKPDNPKLPRYLKII